jgi:hypothetical protein
MTDPDTTADGRGRLTEAMARLLQSQATLIQTQTAFVRDMADIRRELAEYQRRADERFRQIMAVLAEHGQLLEKLREEVRRQFGFRSQKPQ